MTLTATRTAQPFWPRNTLASTVTAIGDALTTGAGQAQSVTVINVTCSGSALSLISAPTLHAGFHGQPMEIRNIGANELTLQDEQSTAGTLLKFGYPRLTLVTNQSISLAYSTDSNKWLLVSDVTNLAPNSQVTFATGGQAGAVPLYWPKNVITTVVTAGDSVKLWPALGLGLRVHVMNSNPSNYCDLFPEVGDAIDGMSVNQQISISPSTGVTLLDTAAGMWRTS